MCGIAGFTTPAGVPHDRRATEFGRRIRSMAASMRHRGPDLQRTLLLDGVALAHARLAILDIAGGAQPMRDPSTGVTLVFNGEVFNYVELRDQLSGYRFRTRSDTEVLLAAYLCWGMSCLPRLNGQFAFAVFDPRDRSLSLARDRFGILPLHYTLTRDGLAFASEVKALFAGGCAAPSIDARGIKQALQLWSPVPPRTCFEGVCTLPPASVARFVAGQLTVERWWDLDLGAEPAPVAEESAAQEVGELLHDAVRLRLRADVPIGAYLSGGIDSSVICAIAQRQLRGTLSTFSVAFEDPAFDESRFQREVARMLETDHHSVTATSSSIADAFPDAVRHAEQVLVRAAPAPLMALSRMVRASGGKVVLTGEGSDEIFLGYDLYAETQVRAFWARQPSSTRRAALLRRLYPYLPLGGQGDAVLRHVFGVGLENPSAPAFSHLVRWSASSRLWRLLSPDVAAAVADEDPASTVLGTLPERVLRWRPLARAQYLEMHTLLAGYLLASQGDRMLMSNSVEGRFPFLDHRVAEKAAGLPQTLKMRALTGKRVLRRYARSLVPDAVLARPKIPYRAPVARLLAGGAAPEWARDLLSPRAISRVGLFDGDKVRRLVAKLAMPDMPVSEIDAMGITAVASGQLLAHAFRATAHEDARTEQIPLDVA